MEAKDLIKYCREQTGMSLGTLAEKSGFRRDQINRWENGYNEPRFAFVVWLLQAMGFGLKLYKLEDDDELVE